MLARKRSVVGKLSIIVRRSASRFHEPEDAWICRCDADWFQPDALRFLDKLYNAACAFCTLKKKPEALDALRKARDTGFRDSDWAQRDPDLALLHGDPEFERLAPPSSA